MKGFETVSFWFNDMNASQQLFLLNYNEGLLRQ